MEPILRLKPEVEADIYRMLLEFRAENRRKARQSDATAQNATQSQDTTYRKEAMAEKAI